MGRLFGTAGVRGVYGVQIDEVSALRFGRAVARVMESESFLVGWDGRLSSPSLAAAVVSGVLSEGRDVKLLGLAPLPVTCRSAKAQGIAGIYVTASHNPPEFNGFKAISPRGAEATREEERKIEAEIDGLPRPRLPERRPEVTPSGYTPTDYIRDLLKISGSKVATRVVLDPGNGCASDLAPEVISRMGAEVTTVNDWVDGRFPGRPSEPTRENLAGLGDLVRTLRAEMGIAWDGDADRVAVVDSSGGFVPQYAVSSLAALVLRARRVIISVDMGWGIRDLVRSQGGEVVEWRLGDLHSEYFRRASEGWEADLVTEPWKIMVPEWGPFFDGIMASTLVLRAVGEFGSLKEALEAVPKYHQSRMSFLFEGDRQSVFRALVSRVEEALSGRIVGVSRLDGVKLILEDGWILLRVSGTEPKIRIYVESEREEGLTELRKIAISALRELGVG